MEKIFPSPHERQQINDTVILSSSGRELSMTNLIQMNPNEFNQANYSRKQIVLNESYESHETFYLVSNRREPAQSSTQNFRKFVGRPTVKCSNVVVTL